MSEQTEGQLAFHSPTHGLLSQKEVVSALVKEVTEAPNDPFTLMIGTDSKGHTGTVDFVTAIVLHRHGFGGKYFWQRVKGLEVYNLRDKIYKETILSLQLAEAVVPVIRTALTPDDYNYKLEIHVDVGNTGKTNTIIKEVVGMVTGSGYTVKTKPDAYGASAVADKHTAKVKNAHVREEV